MSFSLVPSMDTKALFNQLTDSVQKIIEYVNQDKNIPPITSSKDQTPFPFSISIAGTENSGVVDMVWNMFKPPI
eukprot:gene542-682_t